MKDKQEESTNNTEIVYSCKLDEYIDVDLHVCNGKCHRCPYGIKRIIKEE